MGTDPPHGQSPFDSYWGVVQSYAPRLLRFAMRLSGGDEEAARDLTQQALVKTAACSDLRLEDDLWPLLKRVMLNAYIDRGRLRTRERPLYDFDCAGSDGFLVDPWLKSRFQAVAAALPAEQIRLLGLVYEQGHSLDEAANLLGITAEAAKQRLKRARHRFRSTFVLMDDKG